MKNCVAIFLVASVALQAQVAQATFSELLRPLQSLLSWTQANQQGKVNRFGLENVEPVHRRPKVEYFTPGIQETLVGPKLVGLKKDAQGHTVLVLEDLVKPPGVVSSAPVLQTSAPKTSTTATSAGISAGISASNPAATSSASSSVVNATATSANSSSDSGQSAAAAAAVANNDKKFHMVDLKIPGGENPESEILPDVAVFKPKNPLESGGKKAVNIFDNTFAKPSPAAATEITGAPSASTIPSVATSTETITTTAAPPLSSSRPTTEENARQSDQFVQTIRQPFQNHVLQDVNELVQSED